MVDPRIWVWLEGRGAMRDVVQWAEPYGDDFARAWDDCPRGDWLLAIAARLGAGAHHLVRAASDCARIALAYVPEGEARPERGLDAAQAWARGELDDASLQAAKAAVATAIDGAPDPAAGAAMVAALCALDAATLPEAAANAAAFAAEAAVLSAADCAMLESLRFTQRECASAVRAAISTACALELFRARASG